MLRTRYLLTIPAAFSLAGFTGLSRAEPAAGVAVTCSNSGGTFSCSVYPNHYTNYDWSYTQRLSNEPSPTFRATTSDPFFSSDCIVGYTVRVSVSATIGLSAPATGSAQFTCA